MEYKDYIEEELIQAWYDSKVVPSDEFIEFIEFVTKHYFKYFNITDLDRLDEIVNLTLGYRDKFNPERAEEIGSTIKSYFSIIVKSYIISKIVWPNRGNFKNLTVS